MRVVADGRELEAHWHGAPPDEAPTIVFLHEGLGSAAQWRDFPAALAAAAGMGALVYSRAGYGRSETIALPRPLSYMQHEGERVLPEVLDAAGVREAFLFGHSDGGSIALVHAGSGSARVRGVIVEAPHLFCEDISVRAIEATREAYERGDLRERLAAHHDDVDVAFWGWNRAWLDPAFRRWNIEGYLDGVRCPVLAIQGADDPYGTLAQLDAIERRVRDVRRVVLPECGHAPHRDHPERVLAEALAFLT
jgi:pimeloyl-ACP methyl ester carboxylesterase